MPSPAPNFVVDKPATLFANSKQSLTDLFCDNPKANPPLKASPAPVVSIALSEVALIVISSIPSELMESARIDGATEFGIYWRIIVPLARPAFAALAILTFLGSWNSFLWPLSVLRQQTAMTLPVGMASMLGGVTAGSEAPIGASMAGATLITIPVIIVFIAVQKHYIAGLTAASIKG